MKGSVPEAFAVPRGAAPLAAGALTVCCRPWTPAGCEAAGFGATVVWLTPATPAVTGDVAPAGGVVGGTTTGGVTVGGCVTGGVTVGGETITIGPQYPWTIGSVGLIRPLAAC